MKIDRAVPRIRVNGNGKIGSLAYIILAKHPPGFLSPSGGTAPSAGVEENNKKIGVPSAPLLGGRLRRPIVLKTSAGS